MKELGVLRPTLRRSVNDLLNLQSHKVDNIEIPILKALHEKTGKLKEFDKLIVETYHFESINASSEIEGVIDPPHEDLTRRDCDLMTTTRHHILELSANQRIVVQNISRCKEELELFTSSVTIDTEETIIVLLSKWNQMVGEVSGVMNDFKFLLGRTKSVFNSFPEEFSGLQKILESSFSSFMSHSTLLTTKKSTLQFLFITEEQVQSVDLFVDSIRSSINTLNEILLSKPELNYIVDGFLKVLTSRIEQLQTLRTNLLKIDDCPIADGVSSASHVVTQMLLVIQHFNSVLETDEDESVQLSKVIPLINLSCVQNLSDAILAFNPSPPTNEASISKTKHLFKTLAHFSNDYKVILDQFWHQTITNSKSSYKLAYVLLNLYRFLYKNGYNIPQGHEENEENEDDEPADGMGLADGTADNMAQDDIDDIDFEDGLTPDTNEPGEIGEDKNEGMDVEHDFDSKLEDVPNPETQEDDKNQESDSEKGDLDEEMGDLDEQGDVLDEKLWDEKDSKEKDEKLEDDNGVESKGQDTETVANENENNTPKPEPENEPAAEGEEQEYQETTDAKFEETQIEENHRQDVQEDEMQIEDNPMNDELSEDEADADQASNGDDSDSEVQEIPEQKPNLANEEPQAQQANIDDKADDKADPDSKPEDDSESVNLLL